MNSTVFETSNYRQQCLKKSPIYLFCKFANIDASTKSVLGGKIHPRVACLRVKNTSGSADYWVIALRMDAFMPWDACMDNTARPFQCLTMFSQCSCVIFADLCVAFVSVLTDIIWRLTVQWYAGDVLCRVVKFMQVNYSSMKFYKPRIVRNSSDKNIETSTSAHHWSIYWYAINADILSLCPRRHAWQLREVMDALIDEVPGPAVERRYVVATATTRHLHNILIWSTLNVKFFLAPTGERLGELGPWFEGSARAPTVHADCKLGRFRACVPTLKRRVPHNLRVLYPLLCFAPSRYSRIRFSKRRVDAIYITKVKVRIKLCVV